MINGPSFGTFLLQLSTQGRPLCLKFFLECRSIKLVDIIDAHLVRRDGDQLVLVAQVKIAFFGVLVMSVSQMCQAFCFYTVEVVATQMLNFAHD